MGRWARTQRRRRRVASARRADRGASLVELALLAPAMMLIVMGTLDLSRGYRMQIQLENGAGQGAAYARISPNDVDCAGNDDIVGAVTNEDPELASLTDFSVVVLTENGSGDLVVPVTGCGGTTVSAGDRVRVDVSATFDVVTPLVERVVGESISLTGSNEVVVQK
ncbi:TadE/TadG family type IV pilus assembly protein [Actinospongicola halichondriae]|uniref:TadE/TadG family type IV pilus assembly protein n=1 Tax=Actinospongicola halichondriae TaxID=3236844 RepID=UPI003D47A10D